MQSATGQYGTQAGEPAQPVQHSVMTASSLGLFFRGVLIPSDFGSSFWTATGIAKDYDISARSMGVRLGRIHTLWIRQFRDGPARLVLRARGERPLQSTLRTENRSYESVWPSGLPCTATTGPACRSAEGP